MRTDLRIVGVDPGTTSGVAVLDLDGELVDYASRKGFSKDRIIQFIVDNGKPLVIATDVSPAPSLVKELASNTGSVLAVPDEDLDRRYKEELVAEFRTGSQDSHVLDALAAAEYARREHSPKLEEIRSRVRKEHAEENLGDVVELVVKGSISISGAIAEVAKVDDDATEDDGKTPVERDWEKIAERRKDRIDLLESKVSNLQEHLADKEDGREPSGVDEEELRARNRVIQNLKRERDEKAAALERAEEAVNRLRDGIERLSKGWLRVPKVDDLSAAEHGIVAVDGYDGEPVNSGVETVLTTEHADGLENEGVNIVPLGTLERKIDLGDAFIVDPGELETSNNQERFMEWLETYRKR